MSAPHASASSRWDHGSDRTTHHANAVTKAAHLVRLLADQHTPGPRDPDIDLAPKLTVTAIHGGESYSIIPDHCTIDVDIRLTPSYDQPAAQTLIEQLVAEADRSDPTGRPTMIDLHDSWPAYHLGPTAAIRTALLAAAERHLPQPPPPKVAGPSNIGNYLAKLGIDATAGLGVTYHGLHGTDERIDLATIPMIQAVYHEAVLCLLSPDADAPGTRRL